MFADVDWSDIAAAAAVSEGDGEEAVDDAIPSIDMLPVALQSQASTRPPSGELELASGGNGGADSHDVSQGCQNHNKAFACALACARDSHAAKPCPVAAPVSGDVLFAISEHYRSEFGASPLHHALVTAISLADKEQDHLGHGLLGQIKRTAFFLVGGHERLSEAGLSFTVQWGRGKAGSMKTIRPLTMPTFQN